MSQSRDPVCGEELEVAGRTATYRGRTWSFCSLRCLRRFESDPDRYSLEAVHAMANARQDERERHEPPRTTRGGFTAPKFGSAGSGGLEYELLPEAHENDAEE